ncbi:M48 family metallopeptidase [Methanobrevibacter sp. DSM 116169]|uniref:M48 family metallopeptidase n=1 Tax=Methanobrevibacter sp. DSM 116169 TaxID=3242727 RepID=UPI0038FC3E4E
MISYNLIRTNRKTLSIKICKDGSLEVRSPINFPKVEIDKIIEARSDEIAKKSEIIKKKNDLKRNFKIDFNSKILLKGELCEVLPTSSSIASYDDKVKVFYIPETATSYDIKEIIISFYKIIAKKHFISRVNYFKEILDVTPSNVKVNSAKTRWGSCSYKHSLNFSWRLIMADLKTIDYVIVHELSHIKELNHSQDFWNIVESVIPDYKVYRNNLKDLSEKLSNEDWD